MPNLPWKRKRTLLHYTVLHLYERFLFSFGHIACSHSFFIRVIKAKLQSRFQDYVRDDKLLFPELDSQREEFYYLLDTNYDDVVDGLEVFHYFAARPENAVKSIQEISAMTKSFLQKYNRKNNNIITWQEFFDSRFTSA